MLAWSFFIKKIGRKMDENNKGLANLQPVRTTEEAKARGTAGGIKSGETRRLKKTMRKTAETLLSMKVVGLNNEELLEEFGIEKDDQNYQTAVVVRLIQKALIDGDIQATRLLAELAGEIGKGVVPIEENLIEAKVCYPQINIPSNGRDKTEDNSIAPQAGPQTQFMTTDADIVIYGGAAGGGKTYALLLEGLRHRNVKNFGAVIFRHSYNQVAAEGGLWDASQKVYSQVEGAVSGKAPRLHWTFNGKAKLNFAYLSSDDDLSAWQGTEIAYIGFDELTHFTRRQFFYMLSRNRTTCGVKPYIRATCNPDADSWVAKFIEWWIDQDTGYANKDRSGKVRYMTVLNDEVKWGNTREELAKEYGITPEECKSVTFIASSLQDNKVLMESDPGYMANLKALSEIDMERLLYGNWKIKAAAGKFFKRTQVQMCSVIPEDIEYWCRAWDLAATSEDENGDADYTAGVLMGRRKNGEFVVLDVINVQIKAGEVEKLIIKTAIEDRNKYGYLYRIHIPQDPGAAGKIVAQQFVKNLAGFDVKSERVSGNKESRATPLAAQWQNGNVQVLTAEWNDSFFSQLESFPDSKHDDMVDAVSDAFNELSNDGFVIDSLL